MKKTVGFSKLGTEFTFEVWLNIQNEETFIIFKKIHEGVELKMNLK